MDHVLDPSRSEITLHTGTTGLFSAVAHDLEIAVREPRGEASFDAASAHGWIECPVRALVVVGAVKRGRVDAGVLSAGDRGDIERRIREVILPIPVVRIEATVDEIAVQGPSATQRLPARWTRADENGAIVLRGAMSLSLKKLGIAEVKGPLGAFRVADEVAVSFRVVWVNA